MKPYLKLTDPSVGEQLQAGALAVLPTDTVYGVVCSAANQAAVTRLYHLKHRDHKPGTIIAASIDQLVDLGLKRRYLQPITQYWPGAISVVIPCGQDLDYLHMGVGSLAVRIPDNQQLLELLQQTGPLLTSSANHPGEPVAVTAETAEAYFADQVDFYVDGGDLSANKPSTIIRIVDDAIEVLRPGAVTIEE